VSKADTNRKFVSTILYRDNYDGIFNKTVYDEKEGAVEDSKADLNNDINDKRIYQKDNSHGSDFKEDIGTIQ
jgi:hypothetical protein